MTVSFRWQLEKLLNCKFDNKAWIILDPQLPWLHFIGDPTGAVLYLPQQKRYQVQAADHRGCAAVLVRDDKKTQRS